MEGESSDSEDDADDDPWGSWDLRDEWEEVLQDAEEQAEESPNLPIVVAQPGHATAVLFMDPANRTQRWARQTLMKIGTPQEATQIYCNLHGCSKCKKSGSFPSVLAIRTWLQLGASLPRGLEGRARHLAMWPAA